MLRRWLILTHRYLGVALSLLIFVWFASGIAMIYARGMPGLTADLRLDRLPPLDLDAVAFSPAEAADRAGVHPVAEVATLLTILERPAYRFGRPPGRTVFADTGEMLEEVDAGRAASVAARFLGLPVERLRFVGTLQTADQWTIGQRRQMPLHRFAADDAARTELYVAAATGEVVVLTSRGSRALAWVAAIPHWLYFAPLRLNDSLWRQTVLWTAGLGSLVALGGIILGIVQLRVRRPIRLHRIRSYLPYSGLMRWHYVSGLIFGIFTLTWVFSGFLSMDPFDWTDRGPGPADAAARAFTIRPGELDDFPALGARTGASLRLDGSVREIQFLRLQGEPYLLARGRSDLPPVYHAVPDLEPRSERFDTELLLATLREVLRETGIAETHLLSGYDAYYYARGGSYGAAGLPLPVLRVKLDDPDRTWLYIDPLTGQLARSFNRLERVERWLYNGLHSLDFGFWYNRRPLWDIGVIALSLGGLLVSGAGLVLGVRRIRRYVRRVASTSTGSPWKR
jgi:hypothetical protein